MACKLCGYVRVWFDGICVSCLILGPPEGSNDKLGLGVAPDAHVDAKAEELGETVDVESAGAVLEVGGHENRCPYRNTITDTQCLLEKDHQPRAHVFPIDDALIDAIDEGLVIGPPRKR